MIDDTRPPPTPTERMARYGLWALPIYSALLVAATLTHQPSFSTDFPGYARYTTTPEFLASHIIGSITGAAFGIVGFVALWVLVTGARNAWLATVGLVASILGSSLITAVFGVAAFAQPAIGRAFLAGQADVVALNADVYGVPLFAVAGMGVLIFMLGGLLLGIATARRHPRLRAPGIAYAILVPAFALSGFLFETLQPVAAAGLFVATCVLALRLRQPLDGMNG